MKNIRILSILKDERGVVAVIVGVFILFVGIGIAAFAIDFGYRHVVQNELQNAADAGALAGANELFSAAGSVIEPGCNQIAYDTATANLSAKTPVEVNWVAPQSIDDDVLRGHWSFTTREFTPNDTLVMTDLWGASEAELDIDTDYINAVQATVRRESTPTPSFFARIFGHDDFKQTAKAVAYIGFAGTFAPGELDFPIALCEEVVYPDPDVSNEEEDPVCTETVFYEKEETAMWTNLIQPDQTPDPNDLCNTNASELSGIVGPVIQDGNQYPLIVGEGIGATNGTDNSVLMALIPEWETASTNPDGSRKVTSFTFPVVDCSSSNTCPTLTGAVNVQILWIIRQKVTASAEYAKAPYDYYDADVLDDEGNFLEPGPSLFSSTETDDATRMQDFVSALNLPTQDDAGHEKDKRVFFKLDCETAPPLGGPGGINSGVHADRAVLVK